MNAFSLVHVSAKAAVTDAETTLNSSASTRELTGNDAQVPTDSDAVSFLVTGLDVGLLTAAEIGLGSP
ncbi:MAG: hypothetical protein WCD21_36470 [Streptomyces sp.]